VVVAKSREYPLFSPLWFKLRGVVSSPYTLMTTFSVGPDGSTAAKNLKRPAVARGFESPRLHQRRQ